MARIKHATSHLILLSILILVMSMKAVRTIAPTASYNQLPVSRTVTAEYEDDLYDFNSTLNGRESEFENGTDTSEEDYEFKNHTSYPTPPLPTSRLTTQYYTEPYTGTTNYPFTTSRYPYTTSTSRYLYTTSRYPYNPTPTTSTSRYPYTTSRYPYDLASTTSRYHYPTSYPYWMRNYTTTSNPYWNRNYTTTSYPYWRHPTTNYGKQYPYTTTARYPYMPPPYYPRYQYNSTTTTTPQPPKSSNTNFNTFNAPVIFKLCVRCRFFFHGRKFNETDDDGDSGEIMKNYL